MILFRGRLEDIRRLSTSSSKVQRTLPILFKSCETSLQGVSFHRVTLSLRLGRGRGLSRRSFAKKSNSSKRSPNVAVRLLALCPAPDTPPALPVHRWRGYYPADFITSFGADGSFARPSLRRSPAPSGTPSRHSHSIKVMKTPRTILSPSRDASGSKGFPSKEFIPRRGLLN